MSAITRRLLCANVPEFFWLVLALAGVEPVQPASLFDATLQNLHVAMTYSHNLAPAILQGVVVAGLVFAWYRNGQLALWCGGLTLFHVLSDLVVGFEHQWLAPDSMRVSLNTYGTVPLVALAIELIFTLACVSWYQVQEKKRGRPIAPKRLAALYAVFIIGVAIWVPTATVSLRQQLHALGVNL